VSQNKKKMSRKMTVNNQFKLNLNKVLKKGFSTLKSLRLSGKEKKKTLKFQNTLLSTKVEATYTLNG
jgi:hypothetical protein